MAKVAILGAVLLTAVLCGALGASCDDDDGPACTDEYAATCEDDYAICEESLDHTSASYPDLHQACVDALCGCFDEADCPGDGINCLE